MHIERDVTKIIFSNCEIKPLLEIVDYYLKNDITLETSPEYDLARMLSSELSELLYGEKDE